MPKAGETQEQEIVENRFLENLTLLPAQVRKWFTNNIVQRTLAHLVGWTGEKAVMLKCLSDGTLKVTTAATGKTTGNYNQVSIGTTATLIKASNLDRISIVIKNPGTDSIYIGFDSSVATDTGFLLETGAAISFDSYLGPFYGIVATGTQTVSYMEV